MSKERVSGVAELVPWLFPVTDGIVACKDSSLLATFEVGGVDIDSTDGIIVDAIMQRIDRAYYALAAAGCTVWVNVLRYTHDFVPNEMFSNESAQRLFDIHREVVRRTAPFRMRVFISVLLPKKQGTKKIFANISDRISEGEDFFPAVWHGLRTSFSSRYAFAYRREQLLSACDELEQILETVMPTLPELDLRRLRGPQFWGFLRSFVSDQARPEDPLEVDMESMGFFDTSLPDAEIEVGRHTLRIGNKYLSALSIKEWPSFTTPAVIEAILTEGSNVHLSFGMRFLDPPTARKTVMRIRQYAEVTRFRLVDYIMAMRHGGPPPESKASAARMKAYEEALAAEQAVDAGDIAIGYGNLTILVEGADWNDAFVRAANLRKRLSLLIPGIVHESIHLVSAFSATMPGQIYEPIRWSILTNNNLTDATWFRLPMFGDPVNRYLTEQLKEPCPSLAVLPTVWGTPYHFNFHDGALGHTMVIGPSRSGKSVFINFLISQWLKYEPCHVLIFDKDKSCKINAMLHGGRHYDLGEESSAKLNPLSLVKDRRHHAFLTDWIISLIEMRGYKATAEDVKAVGEALEELYVNASPEHARLRSVDALLPNRLKLHLSPYVDGGQYAYMFDNAEDRFAVSGITCVEMGDLLRIPAIAAPFIDYAFYRITDLLEQNRSAGARPSPTLIYLEECWFLLENPRFASRIRDWLKTLAKMNAILVMTTQSLDDMIASDAKVFAAIRDNIPTKILLPNPRAATESLRRLYVDQFGVPEQYIDMISKAGRSHYLIMKSDHAKMIRYRFTSDQLCYLRSDSAALAIFEEEVSKGPGWEDRYLRRCADELNG